MSLYLGLTADEILTHRAFYLTYKDMVKREDFKDIVRELEIKHLDGQIEELQKKKRKLKNGL